MAGALVTVVAPAIRLGPLRAALAPRTPWHWDRVTRSLALEILARHGESLPTGGHSAAVVRTELTSTGMAVVFLGPRGEPPRVVVKLPLTPGAVHGLERETTALGALHADQRLGTWRSLIPRTYAGGRIEGQIYRVDSFLQGRPITRSAMTAGEPGGAWRAGIETICLLHETTATRPPQDFDRGGVWVDAHLRELESRSAWRGATLRRAERLRDELHAGLAGWAGRAGAIHGDYWLGNLLFAGAGAGAGAGERDEAPAGIVDWDAWAPLELPLHDVLHLLLNTRGMRTRRELGEVLADQLRARKWSASERLVLERAE
ncbi:MAG: phosphotransferase family protein, partial [Solirubrobacteraceae bacterium]